MAQPTDTFTLFKRGLAGLGMGTAGLCAVGVFAPDNGTGWIATLLSGAVCGYIGTRKNFPTWCRWTKSTVEKIVDIDKTACAAIMALGTGWAGWKISSTPLKGIIIGVWGGIFGGYLGYSEGTTGIAKKVKDVVTDKENKLQYATIAIISGVTCFILGRIS